jgi:hypothetical protein
MRLIWAKKFWRNFPIGSSEINSNPMSHRNPTKTPSRKAIIV